STRACDERRQARDMVGLHVRLEHSRDPGADLLGGVDVLVDELEVRVDDGQLVVCRAAEQIARTRARRVQKLSQHHRVPLSSPARPEARLAATRESRRRVGARADPVHAGAAPRRPRTRNTGPGSTRPPRVASATRVRWIPAARAEPNAHPKYDPPDTPPPGAHPARRPSPARAALSARAPTGPRPR